MENDIKALLPIKEQDEKQLVEARVLHGFLEVKTRFNDWITRRIKDGRFIEGRDFVIMYSKMSTVIESKNYGLTMRMAEHICMMERTQKGEEARDYFIECEKKVKAMAPQIPTTLHEALQLAADIEKERHETEQKLLRSEEKLAIAAPKADMYDITINTLGTISMLDMAKIIHHPTLGRNNLFKFLRKEGILMRNNLPMRRYEKHFDVVTTYIQHSEYEESKKVTRVYPSGVSFIIGRIIKKLGGWDKLPSKDELDSQFNALAYQEE